MGEQLDLRPARERPGVVAPTPAVRRGRRWVSPLIAILVIGLTALVAWRLLGGPATHAAKPALPPQSVGVATIATGDVDVVLTGLGAVTPLATVTVQTQINGVLEYLGFTEGQLVHRGQFLAEIDPRPYQVALEQAEGTFAHDTALLNQAKTDNARYQALNRQDSIANQTAVDQAFLVKQYEAALITDQGTIDSAKLNLTYCHIVSPVDGRVGIRLVDPGNYVQASNTTGLFVVVELQPISVLFTLPEDDIDALQEQMRRGALTVTAYNRADTKLISTGQLATDDNQIDNTTGTVKLRAMFANTDNALFPQEFVNAHLLLQTLHGVLVAPQAAVQHGAPGDFVYLVKPDSTVAIQKVKLGVSQADHVQILDGLKAGDRVVTDGLDRLRNGSKVKVAAPGGAGAPTTGAATAPVSGPAPGAPAGAAASTSDGAPAPKHRHHQQSGDASSGQ